MAESLAGFTNEQLNKVILEKERQRAALQQTLLRRYSKLSYGEVRKLDAEISDCATTITRANGMLKRRGVR